MSDELDYKTFDLGAVLAGRDYPEKIITVYFNEKLGFTISEVRDALTVEQLRGNDENAADLQKELDTLREKVKDAEYKVHLRAVPEAEINGIRISHEKEFPIQRDFVGRPIEDTASSLAFTRQLWAKMIVKIIDPTGAVDKMTEELAQKLTDLAPKPAQNDINAAINSLSKDSASGFEYAAKQADFLLTASPEG